MMFLHYTSLSHHWEHILHNKYTTHHPLDICDDRKSQHYLLKIWLWQWMFIFPKFTYVEKDWVFESFLSGCLRFQEVNCLDYSNENYHQDSTLEVIYHF